MKKKEKKKEKKKSAAGIAGVISLGCSKNLVDTEFLMGGLAGCGWTFSPESAGADLLLVNTCSFLKASVEESREAIEEALQWKAAREGRTVVVAGCLVSRFGRALEEVFPGVDLFLTPGQIEGFPGWLEQARQRPTRLRGGGLSFLPGSGSGRVVTSPFWAYLKVSDGCDNRCSYCLIPSIRGRHRSRSLRSLKNEASVLLEAGVKELNLVGQDITRWGRGESGSDLPLLVRHLAAVKGEFRLRLLYLHPSRVDELLCRAMTENGKVFPYLDIPIQHASDRILKKMNRPYGRRRLEEMYRTLRRLVPDIALRTTVMVGYPGEGRREFDELVRFLRDHPFENLGAFIFSPEEGTTAFSQRGRVPHEAAEARRREIMTLQQKTAAKLWQGRRGKVTEALLLHPLSKQEEKNVGRTAWQAPEVDGEIVVAGEASPGDLVNVEITDSGAYDLKGVIAKGPRGHSS